VVNPVGVFGPVLGPDYSTSILMVQRLLDGSVPGLPHIVFGVVDVRDVADLHVRAMTAPAAKNERFLAVAGDFMSALAMANALKAALGEAARRVPTRELPDWLLRTAAIFDPQIRQLTPELGKMKNATSEKAHRLLDWTPLPREEAILSTARSLLALGLVHN
jgi:dihydroflavonol-4-reductase